MPANLNALIRYKTIDRCLRNRFLACDIERLRTECSEALGEFRGVYRKVSERTIRDDIRVLRSEILGFNAPIVCEGGYYSYSDPEYSIFGVTVNDLELLRLVLKILLKNRLILKGNEVERVIYELTRLTMPRNELCFSLESEAEAGQKGFADAPEKSAFGLDEPDTPRFMIAGRRKISLNPIKLLGFEKPENKEDDILSGAPFWGHKAGHLYEKEDLSNYRWGCFFDLIS